MGEGGVIQGHGQCVALCQWTGNCGCLTACVSGVTVSTILLAERSKRRRLATLLPPDRAFVMWKQLSTRYYEEEAEAAAEAEEEEEQEGS